MTVKRHSRRRPRGEQGAVAVVVSITLALLVMVAALAIDLGFVRADARRDQTMADFSALAGASGLRHGYVGVCQRALNYVYANADELLPPPPAEALAVCDAFATLDATACDDDTLPIDATHSAEPYSVLVRIPVPDDDPSMTVEGQTVDRTVEGHPCERVKVQIDRDRDFIFAPVSNIFSGASTADAVARELSIGSNREYSSLVILDRSGCRALYVSGQGGVHVVNVDGPDPENPAETITYPGQISLDTLANLPGNAVGNNQCDASAARAIDLGTNQHAFVRAEGDIKSNGLREGRPADKIYDASLLTAIAADGGPKLSPQPILGRMQTRRAVDHQFNCLQTYGTTSDPWQPLEPIEGCPDWSTRPPYIRELVTALQTGDLNGYQVFPDDLLALGASCTTAIPFIIDGDAPGFGRHWRINCPESGQGFSPTFVEFRNVEVVVSENKINLGSSGAFTIRGRESGAILYVRNGNIDKGAQATLTIDNTFVYLHDGTANAGAGDTVLTWRGPIEPGVAGGCASYLGTGLPPAACFSPLALWSNSSAQHTLGGQAPMDIGGTFFTPNAQPFNISGQATQTLDKAQFFSYRIEVSGQGILTLQPNPNTNVETPEWGTGLLR